MSATQEWPWGAGVVEAQHLHHVHHSLPTLANVEAAARAYAVHPDAVSQELAAAYDRHVRAARAAAEGKYLLALVIRDRPGRRIVHEGMADVLHWLKECSCYDADPQRCPWLVQREREAMEQISAAAAIASAHVNEMFQRLKASVEAAAPAMRRISAALGMGTEGLSQDDYALAPPPHRTGRAAQRSPYGPQKGR